MNRQIRIIQNNLRILYYRYKDSLYFSLGIITLVISVCIILFFQIVVPQIQSWFSIREEVSRTRERISNINRNINFVQSLDKSSLNDQVEISTSALPIEKNFGAIINAISDSSVNAGVALDDFTFQVGNVASSEGKLNLFGQKDLSIVTLTVSLTGNIEGVDVFLKGVQEKLPLSEVTDVDGDLFSTTVTLRFFQKQFPVIVYKDDVPLSPLSASNLALIEKLSSWKPAISQTEEVGTGSAENIPLF
jgi:hypothetical protein